MKRLVVITLSLLLVSAIYVSAVVFEPAEQIVRCFYIATDEGYVFMDGRKTYAHVGEDGSENWRAIMSATFIYNGYRSKCTYSGCNVLVTDPDFYVDSMICGKRDSTATTDLTMGRRFLGVSIAKDDYHFALTCDKNGNLN